MKALRIVPVALVMLLVGMVPSAHAQTLLFTLDTPNPPPGNHFGYSVAVGDVNGDGKGDIVAGEPWERVAEVFSGADASQLWNMYSPNWPERFGDSLAVGDVNGDGKADIAVGAPNEDVGGNVNQGRAYVFSGADWSLLFTFNIPSPQANAYFGRSIAVGDVNSDGKADVAVGAGQEDVGGNTDQGRAYVFSGADGSLLLTLNIPGPQADAWFGYSVAAGDVNGDGKADIAVGARAEDVGGNTNQGRAYVLSGADGSLLFTLDNPSPQADAEFGYSVAVGDVSGDGKADIAVGAPFEDVGGNANQGRAYAFSGADGSLLFTLNTPSSQANANFGWSLAAGEMNGDGKADIAVGAPFEDVGGSANQGRVYAFSGADGSLLFALGTPNPQTAAYFGHSVAVGDVNGDGRADIAVGAPNEDVVITDQGRTYVFSGADGSLLFILDTVFPQGGGNFGMSVAMGDVNGDGRGDTVVGAYGEEVDGNPYQGRAYVFSGADGSLLFTLDTPNPQVQSSFGNSVAVGDVNGDGKADIAVGAYAEDVAGNAQQGRCYVFSGADGSLLLTLDTPNPQWNAQFGWWVTVGDVNGDDKADIAVGAPFEDVGGNVDGRAYVFSGADGSLLFTLVSPNPQASRPFGWSVAVGDVNGDGKGDIAVGAVEDVGGNTQQGRCYVFSGADGSLLFTLDTPNPQAEASFGNSVAVGDVNGDGKEDIAVGAFWEDAGGNAHQGRSYVFSGADGSLLFAMDTANPQTYARFGESVAVGDVNGHGKADIAAGARGEKNGQGRAYVFSSLASPPVGGIADLPHASGSSGPNHLALAGVAAALLVALTAGGWYARRRWLG